LADSPLPGFVEPAMSPRSRPDLAARFPLVLTSGKSPQFCHSQHRNLARLRRIAPDPIVELHPAAAAARRIGDGDWVRLATPHGAMRAREAPFRGVMFVGLMVDGERINVLEYNVRFGDPECQPILMRLQSDLLDLLEATVDGKLDEIEPPRWDSRASVCVVRSRCAA